MTDPGYVLDASALLAVLNDEPGAGRVVSLLDQALLSAVNWSEIVQKAVTRGIAATPRALRLDTESLGLRIVSFTSEDAERAAELRSLTRSLGLSLADRACLALAARHAFPVLTTDREWARLDLGLDVDVIR